MGIASLNPSYLLTFVPQNRSKSCNRFLFPFLDSFSQPWVKAQRVVPEDFSFELVADVFAGDQVRNVLTEVPLVALMGIIRRPDERILVADLRRERQRRLLDFDGEENIAFLHILARFKLATRRVMTFSFLLFVHAVHHVGHPADAALDAAESKIRKELEYPFKHHGDELADLRERMLQRVADSEIVHHVETERRHAQTAVSRNGHIQLLGFFPERIKFRTAIKSSRRCDRGQYRADHAELVHGAAQFFDGFIDVLDRQQRNTNQTRADFHELVIEPVVVGFGHTDRPVFILDRAVGQALGRIKHRELDLVLVEKLKPMIRLGSVAAAGPAAFLPERTEVSIHRQPWPERIALMPLEIFIRRTDELAQLAVELHYVSVGVDDSVVGHRNLLLREPKIEDRGWQLRSSILHSRSSVTCF